MMVPIRMAFRLNWAMDAALLIRYTCKRISTRCDFISTHAIALAGRLYGNVTASSLGLNKDLDRPIEGKPGGPKPSLIAKVSLATVVSLWKEYG